MRCCGSRCVRGCSVSIAKAERYLAARERVQPREGAGGTAPAGYPLIRVWFTSGDRPNLAALLARVHPAAGSPATLRALAEVNEMLDRFDRTELAQVLRHAGTHAHFEVPFGWYWDGAPVHGSIDLAYQHTGRWHLVDFETDDVRRARLQQAAAPYLGQIALDAGALQQAVGQAPAGAHHFLRLGDAYLPDLDELREALTATRSRIGAGALLAEPELERPETPGAQKRPEPRVAVREAATRLPNGVISAPSGP